LSRLKQMVNSKTRADHRDLMDGMIRLFAAYRETLEKRSMGFRMTDWDGKLLTYGDCFEKELMELSVNIPLEEALDLSWNILARCFEASEIGMRSELIFQFWPRNVRPIDIDEAATDGED
jgi:V/A-type H+-transporting ATPase subunit B